MHTSTGTSRSRLRLSESRREALRATLWVVPGLLIIVALALFLGTYLLDRAAFRGDFGMPDWVDKGSAGAAREILTALAAAIITVIGLVFSITIVALTLASTQFGPRILRNFTRDRGTQVTLGVFVASFVYVVLALGSISSGPAGGLRSAPVDHHGARLGARRRRRARLLHPPPGDVDTFTGLTCVDWLVTRCAS